MSTVGHPALDLLRIYGDAEEFGVVLAITSRSMGSSVPSIIESLQASAEGGSALAGRVLASYTAADQCLQHMAKG